MDFRNLINHGFCIAYIQFKARIKNEKTLYEMMVKMHKALLIMRKVDNSGAF